MTHNERVLNLLSDGEPHTHHEIYALFVIGHSRIADLRKRGHVINQWRDGDDYVYQLCSEDPQRSMSAAAIPQETATSEQLSLRIAGATSTVVGFDRMEHIEAIVRAVA